MNSELNKLKALVDYLQRLVGNENYDTIYYWLSQSGNFRAGAFHFLREQLFIEVGFTGRKKLEKCL